MKKILALFLALSMVFILAACGGGGFGQKETVTVTFDTDGGEAIEAQTIEKGSALVRPSTPKKTGYIFDKWTLNGNEYEFGTAVNENITLKATWFDPNSGSGGGQSGPLFTARTLVELHIRKGPGTDHEIAGKLPAGSTIEVFETKEAGGYTWNRINETEWVADDGTWLDKNPAGGGSGSISGEPYITLNHDYLHFEYDPYDPYNSVDFEVYFHNGADPNSEVTWTDTTYEGIVYTLGNGTTKNNKFWRVNKYTVTATTSEGLSASCVIEVTGTELYPCADSYTNAVYFYTDQGRPEHFMLCETSYFTNGYFNRAVVTQQCTIVGDDTISYYWEDDKNGHISGPKLDEQHHFRFYDPLNNIYSIEYSWW